MEQHNTGRTSLLMNQRVYVCVCVWMPMCMCVYVCVYIKTVRLQLVVVDYATLYSVT